MKFRCEQSYRAQLAVQGHHGMERDQQAQSRDPSKSRVETLVFGDVSWRDVSPPISAASLKQ
jgi:hypothetical protein